MVTHALIHISPLADTGKRYDYGQDPPPDVTRKGINWVPFTARGPRPAPADPATHKVRPAADQITADSLIESWEEIPLTPEEAAAYADNLDRTTKFAAVGASLATLRQWADDAQSTTVTSGNAVATLQTVVTRLGVFFDRFADLIEGQRIDQPGP